jgi:hypothetical protein
MIDLIPERPLRWDPEHDQELWRVVGDNWAIPFYMRHCFVGDEGFAHMMPAVPLSIEQAEVLAIRITSVRSIKLNAGWAIALPELPKIAKRCTGITPAFWFQWPGRRKDDPTIKLPKIMANGGITASDEDFIEEVAKASRLDKEKLLLVWVAICNGMARWLLNGKPLLFGGLFTVRALPLRRNWLDIMLARVPGLRKVYLSKSAMELLRLFFTGASRWLRCPDLAEAKNLGFRATFRWNLFVSNGAIWNRTADTYEGQVLASIGPKRYLRRWGNLVQAKENEIHRIGMETLEEGNRPCGRMVARLSDYGPRLACGVASPIRHPTILDRGGRSPESLDDFGIIGDRTADIEAAAERLLKVSNEAPKAVDVRAPG